MSSAPFPCTPPAITLILVCNYPVPSLLQLASPQCSSLWVFPFLIIFPPLHWAPYSLTSLVNSALSPCCTPFLILGKGIGSGFSLAQFKSPKTPVLASGYPESSGSGVGWSQVDLSIFPIDESSSSINFRTILTTHFSSHIWYLGLKHSSPALSSLSIIRWFQLYNLEVHIFTPPSPFWKTPLQPLSRTSAVPLISFFVVHLHPFSH